MNPLSSSKSPDKLSRTVEGVVIAVLTAVAGVSFHFFGVDVSQETSQLSDNLQDVALLLGALYSSLMMTYGLVAKIVNKFSERKI